MTALPPRQLVQAQQNAAAYEEALAKQMRDIDKPKPKQPKPPKLIHTKIAIAKLLADGRERTHTDICNALGIKPGDQAKSVQVTGALRSMLYSKLVRTEYVSEIGSGSKIWVSNV